MSVATYDHISSALLDKEGHLSQFERMEAVYEGATPRNNARAAASTPAVTECKGSIKLSGLSFERPNAEEPNTQAEDTTAVSPKRGDAERFPLRVHKPYHPGPSRHDYEIACLLRGESTQISNL